jgi:folate-dependent phosphoribosylglycinamide formyltransferase PurN
MSAEREARPAVVLLAVPGDSTNAVYQALVREYGQVQVILEEPISRWHLLRRRARKLGLRRAASQAAFSALMVPALRWASRGRLEALRSRLGARVSIPESAVLRVPSANAPDCISALRELAPKVVVVNGTRIISAEVLAAVPAVFINTHAGITPRYRGTHGAYWAFAQGRPELAGVTVHLVDRGIDTGAVLGQAVIAREPGDTFVTFPYLQLEAGLPLLAAAVRAALEDRIRTVPSIDPGASQLHYHPGLFEYLLGWLRTGAR